MTDDILSVNAHLKYVEHLPAVFDNGDDDVAHHKFSVDETSYKFQNDKGIIYLSYEDFNDLIHRVENNFYSE